MYFSDPIWDAIDHHLVEIEGVTRKDVGEDLRRGENLGPDPGQLKSDMFWQTSRMSCFGELPDVVLPKIAQKCQKP